MIRSINQWSEILAPLIYLILFDLPSSIPSVLFFTLTLLLTIGRLCNKLFLNILVQKIVINIFIIVSKTLLSLIFIFVFFPLSQIIRNKSYIQLSEEKNHWLDKNSVYYLNFEELN
jgi:hypothetical protein